MPRSWTVSAQSGMERRRLIRVWAGPGDVGRGGGREARVEVKDEGLDLEDALRKRFELRGHFGVK